MLRFRLKPVIWIDALRRRAEAEGAFVMVVQKGDPDGGSVVIWVEGQDRNTDIYTAQSQMDGSRAWHKESGLSSLEAQERISKLKRMDEDMWVIEITDKAGRNFINEPILDA